MVKSYVDLSDMNESDASQSEKMDVGAAAGAQMDSNLGQVTNLTCSEGHTIRLLPQGYKKLRMDAKGRVSQPSFSSFTCKGCLQQVVLSSHGYYSCEETCDFDLCRNCTTCSMDGNMLFESYEIPSQETLQWQ